MQFLQAKSANNKLDARNNLPYAIESIKIEQNGILINLNNYVGNRTHVRYKSVEDLKKEFDIVDSIGEIKKVYKEYDY